MSRWSKIAARLPGRTDNEIKNHWNTHIKKKLLKMGIDPVTHEPLSNKQTATSQETTSNQTNPPSSIINNNHHQPKETEIVPNLEDNSSTSPVENSSNSGDESLLLDSICSDDSLLNSLWLDETPLVDALWDSEPRVQNTNTNHDMTMPSWEDNCAWFLDCQDFGIHDFGFNCFNEIESNSLQALGIEGKDH